MAEDFGMTQNGINFSIIHLWQIFNMKQTAVEWLIFHWIELDSQYYLGEIGRIDYRNKRDSIQIEAKEMEKQQLKEMYLKGIENYDPTFKIKL